MATVGDLIIHGQPQGIAHSNLVLMVARPPLRTAEGLIGTF